MRANTFSYFILGLLFGMVLFCPSSRAQQVTIEQMERTLQLPDPHFCNERFSKVDFPIPKSCDPECRGNANWTGCMNACHAAQTKDANIVREWNRRVESCKNQQPSSTRPAAAPHPSRTRPPIQSSSPTTSTTSPSQPSRPTTSPSTQPAGPTTSTLPATEPSKPTTSATSQPDQPSQQTAPATPPQTQRPSPWAERAREMQQKAAGADQANRQNAKSSDQQARQTEEKLKLESKRKDEEARAAAEAARQRAQAEEQARREREAAERARRETATFIGGAECYSDRNVCVDRCSSRGRCGPNTCNSSLPPRGWFCF